MTLCALLALVLFSFVTPAWGADVEAFPDLDMNDPASLREASRVLEEELKLAARPRTYVVIDLVTATIQIKNRGIDLHRIPIAAWSASAREQMAGTFRLITRPPVVRRKVNPSATVEQEPISLADMPTQYNLSLIPPLSLDVVPAAREAPLRWAWAQAKRWWWQLKNWRDSFVSSPSFPIEPHLQLTLSLEQAQSLAWSLVDGMPVVIRRSTDK